MKEQRPHAQGDMNSGLDPVNSGFSTVFPPRVNSEPKNLMQPFEHSALDLETRSIRLIEICAETSAKAPIACEVRHASIESSYICLSYVWGAEDLGECITLNGKSFRVRKNLVDFLHWARRSKRLQSSCLWIDALCIDQSNVREKTRQVQQMGLIFSRAQEVIAWLGLNEDIAGFLAEGPEPTPSSLSFSANYSEYDDKYSVFLRCEYWWRAWITQEVVLARHLTFMARDAEMDGKLLPQFADRPHRAGFQHLHPSVTNSLKGSSLFTLMTNFKLKQAALPRDRIFCLLALCGVGSTLSVDYESSSEQLAKQIFKDLPSEFCLCSLRLVKSILHIPRPVMAREGGYLFCPLRTQPWKPTTAYYSSLSQEHPFARISAKTATSSLTLPCIHSSSMLCQRLEWSHAPSIALRALSGEHTDSNLTALTINLHNICDRLTGFFTIFIDFAYCAQDGFAYTYDERLPIFLSEETIREHMRHTAYRGDRGCSVELSASSNSCTISFSFGFILTVANEADLRRKFLLENSCYYDIKDEKVPRTVDQTCILQLCP